MGCACYHNDEGLLGFQIPFDVGKAQESWDQVVNGAHNDPTCEGQSVVNTNYFQNLYPEFCAQATNGKASDWTRGILPGENFGGYNFKFKATGGGTCQTCEYAFSKIMEKCKYYPCYLLLNRANTLIN
jgi:hypothetical protein